MLKTYEELYPSSITKYLKKHDLHCVRKSKGVFKFIPRKECNIPKNFYINISIWHQSGIKTYNKWKHLDTIRAFVYDDGYDYSKKLKIDCYCPAYDKNGKLSHELTCDKCKICFQKKAKVCGCYDH